MNASEIAAVIVRIDHAQQDLERRGGRHADSPYFREAHTALTGAMEALRALGAEVEQERD